MQVGDTLILEVPQTDQSGEYRRGLVVGAYGLRVAQPFVLLGLASGPYKKLTAKILTGSPL